MKNKNTALLINLSLIALTVIIVKSKLFPPELQVGITYGLGLLSGISYAYLTKK